MMHKNLFRVTAGQIARLKDHGLIDLLRSLLHAEARSAGLPLAGVDVPAQITIPDGGEDGRMSWIGGANRTDYLPRRFNAFQAKATAVAAAKLASETQVATRKRQTGAKVTLRPVLADALSAEGAYIVVTTKALTSRQKAPLLKAIAAGITATGNDPAGLIIEIYDANKLADWASHHQAVALQLNERLGDHTLAGFKSVPIWGRRDDFYNVRWSDDDEARFVLAPRVLQAEQRKHQSSNAWTFVQAQSALLEHLSEPKRVVRVSGASGLGKSRFVYAAFTVGLPERRAFDAAALIYAEHDIVGDAVVQLAERYAQSGADVVLVVDDCPDRVHQRLVQSTMQKDSRLRLVTIDVENRAIPDKDRLNIEVRTSSAGLIQTIVEAVDTELDETTRSYVADLAEGFPRMAVQGARAVRYGNHPIRSADELVERIVWGSRIPDAEAMRALETASLFDVLRVGGAAPTDLAVVAQSVAEMTATRMRGHLLSFGDRGIVVAKGRYSQVQPLPLAVLLAARRLAVLGSDGLRSLYGGLPNHLKLSLLDRLRWLDTSPEAQALARWLLSSEGVGTWDAVNTELGAGILDKLVHLLPDDAMAAIDGILGARSREELLSFDVGRSSLVWALQKLATRAQTFDRAARLLFRLAAAETENRYANNATGIFKGLFQLHLSGTEADPRLRFAILDEALGDDDPAALRVGIEAAGTMLDSGHFSRMSGFERIGSRPPIKDWSPSLWSEVWDFREAGLSRLEKFALAAGDEATLAQNLIASHVRNLVSEMPLERLAPVLRRIAAHVGVWNKALHGLSECLYFDRRKWKNDKHAKDVRQLFDELMPSSPIALVLLHATGWGREIHNPDQNYEPGAANDHRYGEREIERLVEGLVQDQQELIRCLTEAASRKLDSGFVLGKAIAKRVRDPAKTFGTIISEIERHGSLVDSRLMRGYLAGLDSRDPILARSCTLEALLSPVAGEDAIGIVHGISLGDADVPLLVDLLQRDRINPGACGHLSYGRSLDGIAPDALSTFLDALIERGTAGCWSALEMLHMVLLDRPDLPRAFAERIRTILMADGLISEATPHVHDPHVLKGELDRLSRHGLIDGPLARALVRQLVKVVELDFAARIEFEHESDEMLGVLISKEPDAVWQEIAPLLVSAAGLRRHRLDRFLEPGRDDRSGAGVLFGLPAQLYLNWAREAPDQRASIVAGWLPMISVGADGRRHWHPATLAFMEEFSRADGALSALASRMRPSGWSGSLVPYLEPWLPLLEELRDHGNGTINRWAISTRSGLQRQIEAERADDAERGIQ